MEFNTLCLILSIAAVVLCAVFFAAGVLYRKKVAEKQIGSAEEEARRIINEAIKGGESKKREMLLEAKEEIHKSRSEYEQEVKERRAEVSKQERRLQQKEEALDKKINLHEKKEDELAKKIAAIDKKQEEVDSLKRSQMEVLEKISGLTQDEAKAYILKGVEDDVRHETAMKIKEIETQMKEEADQTAREIIDGEKAGQALHLTTEELAFYDALTKPEAVRDFYTNDQLLAITHELTDALRKNKTIDWNLKESARAGMRRLVKRLLKKYKYPPEGQEDALNTIMEQCEMWSENS